MPIVIRCLLACWVCVALPVSAACSRVMRVGWDEFPPYVYSNQDGAATGMDAELARRIFKEAGCRLEFVKGLPAKRQAAYLQSGAVDMQLGASDVKERRLYAWYSLPYRRELIALVARHGEAAHYPLKQLDDLALHDWQILEPYEGWYGTTFMALLPELRTRQLIYTYVGSSQGLAMLYHNRGDLLVGDFYSLLYTARAAGLPDPEALAVPVNDNRVHLIFSKRTVSKADVASIDAAIARLEAAGELRRIGERYAGVANGGNRNPGEKK